MIEDETLGDLSDPDGGDGILGAPGDKPAEEAGGSDDPQAGGADAKLIIYVDGKEYDEYWLDEGDEGDGATSRAGTDDPASAADQS